MGTSIFLPHKTMQHKDIHYTSNYNKCMWRRCGLANSTI